MCGAEICAEDRITGRFRSDKLMKMRILCMFIKKRVCYNKNRYRRMSLHKMYLEIGGITYADL